MCWLFPCIFRIKSIFRYFDFPKFVLDEVSQMGICWSKPTWAYMGNVDISVNIPQKKIWWDLSVLGQNFDLLLLFFNMICIFYQSYKKAGLDIWNDIMAIPLMLPAISQNQSSHALLLCTIVLPYFYHPGILSSVITVACDPFWVL
jgi:hypothetical protein